MMSRSVALRGPNTFLNAIYKEWERSLYCSMTHLQHDKCFEMRGGRKQIQ